MFLIWHLNASFGVKRNVIRGMCHKKLFDESCENLFSYLSQIKWFWAKFQIFCQVLIKTLLPRELIKVIQRNFRQFLKLRNWGWFSLIQKTRPLVGMVDIEVVIQELESAANEAVADVQNEINEKRRLEDENKKLQVS